MRLRERSAWDVVPLSLTGGTAVVGNRANDNIDCTDNVPAPTGSGNVAGADGGGSKTGQCAGL